MEQKENGCAPRERAHVALRTPRPKDPGYDRSTRARVKRPALPSQVTGTRVKGTSGRKPYLKEIADNVYLENIISFRRRLLYTSST